MRMHVYMGRIFLNRLTYAGGIDYPVKADKFDDMTEAHQGGPSAGDIWGYRRECLFGYAEDRAGQINNPFRTCLQTSSIIY